MNSTLRQIIASICIIIIAWLLYYGSFAPLSKAQQYIKIRQTQINSLAQFDKIYGGVLGYSSPVGQDEIVSNYLEVISQAVSQEKGKEKPNEGLIRALVASSSMWADPIIQRGSGFGFSQIIYNYANIYRDSALALKDRNYYEKAVDLFKLGLLYSPDRQIFLYSLFDLYMATGDKVGARLIGNRIMEVYGDARVDEILKKIKS